MVEASLDASSEASSDASLGALAEASLGASAEESLGALAEASLGASAEESLGASAEASMVVSPAESEGDLGGAPLPAEAMAEPGAGVLDAIEMTPSTTDEALAQSFDDDVDAVIATQEQDLEDVTLGEGPTDEAIETAAADTVLADHAPSSTSSADDTGDSVIDPVE